MQSEAMDNSANPLPKNTGWAKTWSLTEGLSANQKAKAIELEAFDFQLTLLCNKNKEIRWKLLESLSFDTDLQAQIGDFLNWDQ